MIRKDGREEYEETERKKMKLIELVRQHEVLYNTAHPDHLNTSITDVLWEEIAAILQEDGKLFILNNVQNNNIYSIYYFTTYLYN